MPLRELAASARALLVPAPARAAAHSTRTAGPGAGQGAGVPGQPFLRGTAEADDRALTQLQGSRATDT